MQSYCALLEPVLPGAEPAEWVWLVAALSVGAGAADIVPPFGAADAGAIVEEGAGAGGVFPEAIPGIAIVAEFAELLPAGAGEEVCAKANPTEPKNANAVKGMVRIAISFSNSIRLISKNGAAAAGYKPISAGLSPGEQTSISFHLPASRIIGSSSTLQH